MKITDTVTDCTTNDLHATTPETSTQTAYDGTTSLALAMDGLGLRTAKNNNRTSQFIKIASSALNLPTNAKGGAKTPAERLAIYEWLSAQITAGKDAKTIIADSLIKPDLPNAEPNVDIDAPPPETTVDTATPSNEIARLTESFSNEMAHTPIQIRHVSHLNQSMQVVINDEIILDIKATHALALEFHDISAMHGQRVGELLLQVKAELKHGDFLPWLESNVGVSTRQANRYMRGAKGLPPTLRTTNQNRHAVSYLNSPADLVAQVESPETETLRIEYEKLQNELIAVKAAADYAAQQVRMDLNTSNHLLSLATVARDDLKSNQDAIIDAKVTAAAAVEINKTQALEKQLSDAKDKIARDKKDLDKAITDGVRCKMNELDNEIRRKELSSEGLTESIKELRETKSELNEEVGAIQKHNKSVEKIKDYLTSVKGYTWDLLDDSASTPVENLNDWYLIDDALDKLKQDVADIISNGKTLREVIKSQPIDGELV